MEVIKIYPENPNPKEINKVVNVLKEGGLIVYPTDTVYATLLMFVPLNEYAA